MVSVELLPGEVLLGLRPVPDSRRQLGRFFKWPCRVVYRQPLENPLPLRGFATAWRLTASSSASLVQVLVQVLVALLCCFLEAVQGALITKTVRSYDLRHAAGSEPDPGGGGLCDCHPACASSLLGRVEADGCGPNEVGPGAWLKMTQDKTRQDEAQVSGGSSSSLSLRQCSWVGLRFVVLRLYLTRSYRAGFEHWEVP